MNPVLKRIHDLEGIARRLEPSADERRAMSDRVFDYSDEFLNNIDNVSAFRSEHNHGLGLAESPISDDPIDIDEALRLIRENVDAPALNPASGGHLGYIPGGGLYPSSLGDYLADVTNRFAGVYFVAPGAVRMEHMVIKWIADLVGYPRSAGGDLTSGGSVANLSGIVGARDAHQLKARDVERTTIYLTSQVHHSIDKALRIAGLNECIQRLVDMDNNYRMKPQSLQQLVAEDRKQGLNPWMVVASAGTTDTGAIDPINSIGEIAENEGLWFHLDGAYGAFFVLCDEGKKVLQGMHRADSLVMDPHKGLFLPYGTGAILFKDRNKLKAAHDYTANYMQDTHDAEGEYSPADHSPELTRHFRGLRCWLPLKLFGVAPFRACLEEKLWLARYFHEQIQQIDGFEVGPAPDLSVATYRYVPKKGDANAFNRALVNEVHKDGRVFLSSTMLEGNVILRLAVLCFRTHLDTIETTLEVLRERSEFLAKNL